MRVTSEIKTMADTILRHLSPRRLAVIASNERIATNR